MRNILLIIDLQKDFIYGSLTVPGATQVLPAINEVKDRFDLVYFTLDWHPVNHCSFREQGGPWPVHCVHHTAGAALDESVLFGLPEEKTRFILKGCVQGPEEYGAFVGFDPANQDLFAPGDEVVICGSQVFDWPALLGELFQFLLKMSLWEAASLPHGPPTPCM